MKQTFIQQVFTAEPTPEIVRFLNSKMGTNADRQAARQELRKREIAAQEGK